MSIKTRSTSLVEDSFAEFANNRVWYKGLLYKLKSIGVRDPWFESHLLDRKQRVVMDGQSPQWKNINGGVPQDLCSVHYYF
jgi:hypothetical protein